MCCFIVNRWAVSTVMTRQNLIPRQDGSNRKTYGLIPLWDMCNHANGVVGGFFRMKIISFLCFLLSVGLIGFFMVGFVQPACEVGSPFVKHM